jgi:hypothetical protein
MLTELINIAELQMLLLTKILYSGDTELCGGGIQNILLAFL